MQLSEILTLFEYNYWANARVLDKAAKVSAEQLTAPAGTSHNSLRGSLAHTYGVEWLYRVRCQEGAVPTAVPRGKDFPTLDALCAAWQAEEQAMRAYLASLRAEDLQRDVTYQTTSGVPYENKLWELLLQVILHGMQTRSEAAMALTAYGQSPGDFDFVQFLRES